MFKNEQEMPSITAATYTVVSSEYDDNADCSKAAAAYEVTGTPVVAVELNAPAPHSTSPEHSTEIPQARGLTWRDDFFEDEVDSSSAHQDIVAVFDFDYGKMESYYKCLSWGCVGVTSACCPSFIPWMLIGLVPCYLGKNVSWNVRAQHIAVTRTGILFVHDRRQACWGRPCWEVGKQTIFIPFDQISDCTVITEGFATTTCAVASHRLSHVTVSFGGSCGPDQKKCNVMGLENPHAFQKLVMSLKRDAAAPAMVMNDREILATAASRGEDTQTVTELLREIRDELRNNSRNTDCPVVAVQPPPSAPVEAEESPRSIN
mmetsp:Transcript_13815/g.18031  ORF Transcript_13815/g.18031 Transcript_13815/m.18031 type:complete len:318 (+) Transcript_13815:141-1094(+)|eukprot:CAMPEP_0198143290 /NCGR_PEP_ID=MMETSP1443-20131203/6266_1 /TAXON_ID=186043 /ORGANISM="Entomoneis sp., Strain CCMP2396" /LENGTH=317 /DNA_ID=CAMNT_0043806507 /DNA_START=131 /DNA_END=1087 /DNA_ORIENTATION=+